jgi:hypothetical protein
MAIGVSKRPPLLHHTADLSDFDGGCLAILHRAKSLMVSAARENIADFKCRHTRGPRHCQRRYRHLPPPPVCIH